MWPQSAGRDCAEPSGIEILKCLSHFRFRIHDERPVVEDRLADRFAAQQEDVHPPVPGVLGGVGGDGNAVAGSQYRKLALAYRVTDRSDGSAAGEHIDQRVEIPVPSEVESGAGFDGRVNHRDRGVGRPRPGPTVYLTGDHP